MKKKAGKLQLKYCIDLNNINYFSSDVEFVRESIESNVEQIFVKEELGKRAEQDTVIEIE